MNVIILASGKGTINDGSKHICAYSLKDNDDHSSNISRLISQIYKSCTVESRNKLQFTVVVGYHKQSVIEEIEYLRSDYDDIVINIVLNTNYNNKRGNYELACARYSLLSDDTLIINGDIVYDSRLIGDIINFTEDFQDESFSFIRDISELSIGNICALIRSYHRKDYIIQYIYDKYSESSPIQSLSFLENCEIKESIQVYHYNETDSKKLFEFLDEYFKYEYSNLPYKPTTGKESNVYSINCMISHEGMIVRSTGVPYSQLSYTINTTEDFNNVKNLLNKKEIL